VYELVQLTQDTKYLKPLHQEQQNLQSAGLGKAIDRIHGSYVIDKTVLK
jgi:hypothetical protein